MPKKKVARTHRCDTLMIAPAGPLVQPFTTMKTANILAIATLAAAAAPLATAQTPAPKPIPSPAPLPCPDRQVDRAAILNNIVRELEAAGLPPHEILGLMKVIAPKVVNAPAQRHAKKPKRGPKAIPAVRIKPAPAPKAQPKEAGMKLFINGKEVDPDMVSGSVITRGDLKIREVDPRTLNLPTPPAPKPGCKGPKPGPKPEGCPLPPAPKPGCAAPKPAPKPEGCPLPPGAKPGCAAPKPGCDKAPAPRPTIKINGQEMPLPAEGGKVIINTDGGVTVLPAPKPGCAAPKSAPKPEGCPLPPAPKPGCAAPKPAPKPEGCPLPPAPVNGGTIAKPVIGGADAPIATPKPAPEQKPAAGPVIKINGQPVELPEGGGKVIINADGRIISRG